MTEWWVVECRRLKQWRPMEEKHTSYENAKAAARTQHFATRVLHVEVVTE
jgi:hypothetical protein